MTKYNAPFTTGTRLLCILLWALFIDLHSGHAQVANADTLFRSDTVFYKTFLQGQNTNDTLPFVFSANDQAGKPRYRLSGRIYRRDKNCFVSLNDSLLLNYTWWNIAPTNSLLYLQNNIAVTNFTLTKDSSKIALLNNQQLAGNSIDIAFQNVDVRDITGLLGMDTLSAQGVLNGTVNASEFAHKIPAFTGKLNITQFRFMQMLMGDMALTTSRLNNNAVHTIIELAGYENAITVNGNYYLDSSRQFDAVLDIQKAQLGFLKSFSKGYINRAVGNINGRLQLKGKFKQPEWNGLINFDPASFSFNQFGTGYKLEKQQLSLVYPFIRFNNFTITDSSNNPLTINGDICANNLRQYDLSLDINAKNFTLVNAAKAINNQVFGYASVDANISVAGTMQKPVMKGDLFLKDQSAITLLLPERSIDKDASNAAVRFVDMDTFRMPTRAAFRPALERKIDFTPFINKSLSLHINKESRLSIIIDPSSGDELVVQGEAVLNPGIDSAKNIGLSGSYKLTSGHYELNPSFLSKRFNLLQGSVINFSGIPQDAQIDIMAEYIANTSPRDLLSNEVGEVNPELARSFYQPLPFRLALSMKGVMKKPTINFDIQLPAEVKISPDLRATINNKLSQLKGDIAATNKQTFALLALNRFVGEQSTDFFKGTGGGSGFNDLARESISKFLSAALDQIASDLFKGINVDLNLNSYKDFTNSAVVQKTDQNIEVSKSFLNDRLSVTVGKNFGVEGQDGSAKAARQKGSRFLPDVTVNYKISDDGKYMLRGYNKNQLEVILDGYAVESGAGFIITMDYEKFKELFNRKKKKDGE